MELKKYKLGEFVQSYGDGIHGTPEYNESGEYYFINGNNLETGKIVITDNTLKITETEYQKIKKPIVKGKTILVSINGTLGRYAIYNGEKISLGKSACFLNLKDAKDVPFILTVLKAKEFTSYLERIAGQSTIKNVSPTQVVNYEFYAPALYEKCLKNSTFLLKLDCQIELNRQINQNLEAMAKQLYDYWFVQFDFPNEEGKPYKSSGGNMVWNEKLKRNIPIGWNNGTLIDIANITMGQSPDGTSYNEIGEGVLFYQGSTDFGMRFPSVRQYTTAPSRFAKKGDILMSVRAPVGAVNIANNDCCIGRGLSALNSKIGSTTHLYYILNDLRIAFDQRNAAGTTFGSITKEDLYNLPIVIPAKEVISAFDKICSPMFDRQMLLGEEIDTLIKQRDELLPLLLNGQVLVNSDLAVSYITILR